MRLDHTFTVPVPVEGAWDVLLDLPRIAPCMPGAALTGVEGDSFTGTVKVKLGPIVLTYQGKGRFVVRDEAARRVVIEASGKDTRSAGTAGATVTAVLVPEGEQTRVDVRADVTITGRPAQFGRGMIADVSAKLIGQFADCLASTLGAPAPAVPTPSPASAPSSTSAPSPTPARSAVSEAAGARTAVQVQEQPAARPAPQVRAAPEPAPVDLIRVAGGTAAGRRLGGYLLLGAAVVAVVWLVARGRSS